MSGVDINGISKMLAWEQCGREKRKLFELEVSKEAVTTLLLLPLSKGNRVSKTDLAGVCCDTDLMFSAFTTTKCRIVGITSGYSGAPRLGNDGQWFWLAE